MLSKKKEKGKSVMKAEIRNIWKRTGREVSLIQGNIALLVDKVSLN
jgi:phage terminase Nu1 subunit (DNA packaging protein)